MSEFLVLSAFRAQGCPPILREGCVPSQLARQTRNTNILPLLTDHLFSLWYGLIHASIHLSEQGSFSKPRAFARPRAHRLSQVLVLGDKKLFFFSKKVGYLLSWGAVPSTVVLFSVLLIQVCRQKLCPPSQLPLNVDRTTPAAFVLLQPMIPGARGLFLSIWNILKDSYDQQGSHCHPKAREARF